MRSLRRMKSPCMARIEPLTLSGPSSGGFVAIAPPLRISAYGVCSRLVGLVFCAAALAKGTQLATEPILENDLFSSRALLATFAAAEGTFGLWLLVGLAPRITRALALLWLSALAGVSCARIVGGAAGSACGCFGSWPVTTAQALTFNLLAIAALAVCVPRSSATATLPGLVLRLGMFAGIAAPTSIYGGVAIANFRASELSDDGELLGDAKVVALYPQRWVGRELPLLRFIDVGESLRQGRWIVALVQQGCAKCEAAIEEYEELARRQHPSAGLPRVAVIQIPTASGAPIGRNGSGSSCLWGQMSPSHRWYVRTPLELSLDEGRVRQVTTAPR
jgi:hypothetical protein